MNANLELGDTEALLNRKQNKYTTLMAGILNNYRSKRSQLTMEWVMTGSVDDMTLHTTTISLFDTLAM